MSKLNQIIAIEKGVKGRVYSTLTDINKAVQKPDLFNGFVKSYIKKEEDGEELQQEKKKVQLTGSELLTDISLLLTELMDLTARKDYTNCNAGADVVVDGQVLVSGAPVTYLLFLEKQLTDVRTFIGNIPVLDNAENWTLDDNSGLYRTDKIITNRTKKIARPIVLYPATDKHPAQTQLIQEDIIAGSWEQVKQSGALPMPRKEEILRRIEILLSAVKQAREAGNGVEETESPRVGAALFGYLFAGGVSSDSK